MDVAPSTLLAVGLPLLGLAGTWATMGYRIRRLEQQVIAIDDLRKLVEATDAKIEFVRKDQGTRLGKNETKVDGLTGQFDGFKFGFSAGRRSKTAAQGVPVKHADGDEVG